MHLCQMGVGRIKPKPYNEPHFAIFLGRFRQSVSLKDILGYQTINCDTSTRLALSFDVSEHYDERYPIRDAITLATVPHLNQARAIVDERLAELAGQVLWSSL